MGGTERVTQPAVSVNVVIFREQLRMEEEGRKLLEEGIRKKLVSPGKGELSTFPNGTKVKQYTMGPRMGFIQGQTVVTDSNKAR